MRHWKAQRKRKRNLYKKNWKETIRMSRIETEIWEPHPEKKAFRIPVRGRCNHAFHDPGIGNPGKSRSAGRKKDRPQIKRQPFFHESHKPQK